MTIQVKNIKDSFALLSKTEQVELMHYFLQIVSSSEEKDAFHLSDQWKTELDERDESFKVGKSKAYPIDEVLKQFDF